MIYNLGDLKKAYEAGETFKFLFFWGHTPAADGHINEACLSQWWKQCKLPLQIKFKLFY